MKATALTIATLALAACGHSNSSSATLAAQASQPKQCSFSDALDIDSSDIEFGGFADCLEGTAGTECTIKANEVVVKDLEEGVGTVRAVYSSAADGTHDLKIVKTNGDITLSGSGIPASYSLHDLLAVMFKGQDLGTLPNGCTWN